MKVILANPRGFCAGVNMAIEVVDQALRIKGPPIYVYHEIVHNRHVVESFERQGVVFVNDIADVPEGSTVVYSAHGISPTIRTEAKSRHLIQVDATCPLVTKVHSEVLRFAREGYTIIFIGHHNHDEAIGTVGEAPQSIIVIDSEKEVPNLTVPDPLKVAYVTQTTLSVSEASRTIEALKRKFPHIKGPPKEDICYATTNRQNAIGVFSDDADVVLVVGSKNSSNSRRLVETAKAHGKSAYLIDDQSEIQSHWLAGKNSVLVTAGASAPDHLVRKLVERLERDFNGQVESRTLVEENLSFELPRSLKVLTAKTK